MRRSLLVPVLLLLSHAALAQDSETPKTPEEKLKANAIALIRETSGEVARMRSAENRISFSAEMAALMFYEDPKEARAMYAATMADFKQLLADLDAQMNLPAVEDEEIGFGFLFGAAGGRSPAARKMRIAMAVRQQISLSLAEHDPEVALAFFADTPSTVPKPASWPKC